MKIYYHFSPEGNFGDDLNLVLWPRLMPGAFDGEFIHNRLDLNQQPVAEEVLFLGIGTIIDSRVPVQGVKHVFGSGVGYGKPVKLDDRWHFHCVRGRRTAEALGLDPAIAITDPAILIRTLRLERPAKSHPVSFIPHWTTAERGPWRDICARAGISYIDPRRPPLDVIKLIGQTERLITESLHGSIIADALRVPWIPVTSGPNILEFKWLDWCESIGVDYAPARIPAIWASRSLYRRLIANAKTHYGEMALARIAKTGRPQLSPDIRIVQLTERLMERLDSFCRAHGLTVVSEVGN